MRNRYLDVSYKFFSDVYEYACKMYEVNFVPDDAKGRTIPGVDEKRDKYLEPLQTRYHKWLNVCSGKDMSLPVENSVSVSPYFFVKKGSDDCAVFNAYWEAYSAIMDYYNGRTKYQNDKSKDLERALKNWYKLTSKPKQNVFRKIFHNQK